MKKDMLKAISSLVLVLAVLVVSPTFAASSPPSLTGKLQGVLNRVTEESPDHLGILASVEAPRLHLVWSGAAGTIARNSKVPLRPDQTFRIASVTKVFVAAAVFRLVENDRLGLFDPITRYISPETATVLKSGGYDPTAITVAELLGHTSGLATFGPSPAYDQADMVHWREHKRWTRMEQIKFTMQHEKPVGRPGEKYYYSDTGYIILGEIIHRVSGEHMAAYVRQSLNFAALHLNATYWETLEPAPPGVPPRAHQYLGRLDITHLDPSLDLWGGGGLVSNTADLDQFFIALLTGSVFKHRSTLAAALLPVETEAPIQHPSALMLGAHMFGRHLCWSHGGYWGTIVMYCPDVDLAVAINVDQTADDSSHGATENREKLLEGLAAVLDGALGSPTVEPLTGRSHGSVAPFHVANDHLSRSP